MDQRDPRTGKEHREFFNIDLSSGWETIAPGIEAKTLAGPEGCLLLETSFFY
jgi:hypothetical protein